MMSSKLAENKWEMAHAYGTVYGIEEAHAMVEVLSEWAPTTNKNVREFEKKFSASVGAQYGVASNSWVGAAHALAIMLDIRKGDEIVVPAVTFQASANIFAREGARIVFAEVDPKTFNIDPGKLEEKITSRTRAIVAVHMCGQPCDMDAILEIANRRNIIVIQDAAHAPGALYHGKGLGELGNCVIYSFHQSKNMSTLGEGGLIVTNDKEWASNMKKIREHGAGSYIGISSRMTDLQAAVGLVQLERLRDNNDRRRRIASYMTRRLSEIEGLYPPYESPEVMHVYHLYNALIEPEFFPITRTELMRRLWVRKRIMVGTQYSPTVNCLPAFKAMGHGEGECPVSEDVSSRIVSLPISPRFTESDVDELVEGIKDVLRS